MADILGAFQSIAWRPIYRALLDCTRVYIETFVRLHEVSFRHYTLYPALDSLSILRAVCRVI